MASVFAEWFFIREYLSGLGLRMGARLPVLSRVLMRRSEEGHHRSLLPLVRTNAAAEVTSNRAFHFAALPAGYPRTLAVTIS